MKSTFQIAVEVPTVETFASLYPPYGPWARGEGKFLFDLLMTPENFLRARFATELGFPGVAGIAHLCDAAAQNQGSELREDKFAKQAIGAIICVLLEANGLKKTSERKAIPHPAFTKGTVYKEKNETS